MALESGGDMETLSEFNGLLLKISLFLLEHMVYVVQEMKLIIRFWNKSNWFI